MKKNRKRKISLIMAMALLAAGLTACSNIKSDSGEEEITLTVWQLKPEIAETLPEVFAKYTEQHPNIKITVDRPGGNDYDTTIKAQMASGVYPDLYMVNSYSVMESFAKGGNAQDITDEAFVDNFMEEFMRSISYDGKIYGVPCEVDGVGIIYNKEIFKKAGIESVPKTLDELSAACEKLKAVNVTPFSVGIKDSWTMNQSFSLLHGELMDAYDFTQKMNRGEESFRREEIASAFDFIDIMKNNCNDKPSDSDYSNMCSLFAQGKSAMMVCGMWGMTSVLMIDPDIEVGVFAVPVSDKPEDARLCADNAAVFCMPPQSEHKEETLKLMEWMSGDEFARLYAEKCGIYMPTENAALPKDAESGWEDIRTYIEEGNITTLPFLYYTSGFDAGIALQSYFTGDFSREQVMDAWDELWKSLLM